MANVKGSLMLHTIKALKSHHEAAEKSISPALAGYLERHILHSSWYPEADHLELLKLLARIDPEPNGANPWEHYGRLTAQRDLTDTYDVLVSAREPSRTLEKLPSLWSLYHNTGRFEVNLIAKGKAGLNLIDYALVSAEICANTGGYLAEMLRISGATNVDLRKVKCRAKGDRMCCWDVTWAEPVD